MIEVGAISSEFASALVKAQSEIEGAKKGKRNPGFNSKYADLSACWDACREAFHDAKIAVLQFPSAAPSGSVGLVTTLVYGPTGETLSEAFTMPLKDPSNAQSGGSAITYARRYALCAVIGICPVDDDGNAASGVAGPVGARPNTTTSVGMDAKTEAAQTTSFVASFRASTGVDEMKSVYSKVKNSQLPEPGKTALLADMAKSIKAEKAKEY